MKKGILLIISFIFVISITIFIGEKTRTTYTHKAEASTQLKKIDPKLGQLKRLKLALENPLEQYVSIVFVGDSITWGMNLPENGIKDPRNGTLSDPRDVYNSPSFVNDFKRYIGEKYNLGKPILSNWSSSPSGQSIATYHKKISVFPEGNNFEVLTTGKASKGIEEQESQKQLYFKTTSNDKGILRFRFTGNEFTLSYDSNKNTTDYELLINGKSQGVFSTKQGVDGNVKGYNTRTHKFNYVSDALIEIRTVSSGYLKIGGLIVNKTIKISNQGIIGATTRSYLKLSALTNSDKYVFMQLGTNDRIIYKGVPKGPGEFKKNLETLVKKVKPNRQLILMCPNLTANENPKAFSFHMDDVCRVVTKVANENNLDLIDNYSIFKGLDMSKYLTDGLHPNKLGHQMMFKNIVESLEQQ